VDREGDTQPRAEAPEHEAVDEVDGKRMWGEELEGFQGEELLKCRAQFKGSLKSRGESNAVQSRDVVWRVPRKAGL